MITGGRTQARDEVFALVKTATDTIAGAIVVWQDEIESVDVDATVIAVAMQHAAGDQASLAGGLGKRRWESRGVISIEIRCPVRQGGLTLSDDLSNMLIDTLRGKSTPNGVWFREVVGREVPPKDGNSRTTVTSEFVYQEIS